MRKKEIVINGFQRFIPKDKGIMESHPDAYADGKKEDTESRVGVVESTKKGVL